jgi:hypothetical protein
MEKPLAERAPSGSTKRDSVIVDSTVAREIVESLWLSGMNTTSQFSNTLANAYQSAPGCRFIDLLMHRDAN